jgi:hypothetical protein
MAELPVGLYAGGSGGPRKFSLLKTAVGGSGAFGSKKKSTADGYLGQGRAPASNKGIARRIKNEHKSQWLSRKEKIAPPCNPDELSTDAQRVRTGLRHNPLICEVLDKWWESAVRSFRKEQDPQFTELTEEDRAVKIPRDGYTLMHKVISKTMLEFTPNWKEGAIVDWLEDSQGNAEMMSGDLLCDCIFEIADIWCGSIEVGEYVDFLTELLKQIAEKTPHGWNWRNEKDVMFGCYMLENKDEKCPDPLEPLCCALRCK